MGNPRAPGPALKVSVVVPTYRRPEDMARCLEGLERQQRPADEQMLIVVRDVDEKTRTWLEQVLPGHGNVRRIDVAQPGQVAALNAGLEAAQGNVVAITDDDTVAHPSWLERIAGHFEADPKLGGLGGRDWLHRGGELIDGQSAVVGKVTWFGYCIGNHHLGVGAAREVDSIKGANMSYRRAALEGIRFDTRLRGDGAQYRNDTALCLAVKRKGWKIVYDPEVKLDHFLGDRHEVDIRGVFHEKALRTNVHNTTLVLLDHLSLPGRIGYLAFSLLVGTRAIPGLLQWLRILPMERGQAVKRLRATWKGLWDGWSTWRRSPR